MLSAWVDVSSSVFPECIYVALLLCFLYIVNSFSFAKGLSAFHALLLRRQHTNKVPTHSTMHFKARGWWPGTWSSSKIFFWQFVFPWVDLALLKPMKNFPWEKCVIQATKNKAKSCSFFDAIRRCSCGRSADWLKIDGREIPVSTLETGRSIRYGALCRSKLLSPALRGSLVSPRIVEKATENEI